MEERGQTDCGDGGRRADCRGKAESPTSRYRSLVPNVSSTFPVTPRKSLYLDSHRHSLTTPRGPHDGSTRDYLLDRERGRVEILRPVKIEAGEVKDAPEHEVDGALVRGTIDPHEPTLPRSQGHGYCRDRNRKSLGLRVNGLPLCSVYTCSSPQGYVQITVKDKDSRVF